MKVREILQESTLPSFDGKFPLAAKAVAMATGGPRILEKLTKYVPIIQACLKAGEVVNTQLEEIKNVLNRFVEDAYKMAISEKYLYSGKYEKLPEELQYLDIPSYVRNIGTLKKKLVKISPAGKATEMYKDLVALSDELSSLVEIDVWMKEHKVMASAKRKEAAEAKATAEGEYQKKYTDHKDSKKVSALLKKTASNIEKDIFTSVLKGLQGIVDRYNEKVKETGSTNYRKMYEKNPYVMAVLQNFLKRLPINYDRADYSADYEYKFEKDYKTTMKDMAEKRAAEIIDHFVAKNSGKLSYIMFNKNNLKTVEIKNVSVGNGAVECDVFCVFEDGSQFTANSSVVYAVSKLGKWFYRYPTLFRNVKMPDGSRMSAPTEKKMDEVFAIAK